MTREHRAWVALAHTVVPAAVVQVGVADHNEIGHGSDLRQRRQQRLVRGAREPGVDEHHPLLAHGEVTVVIGGVRVAPGDWIVGDRDGIVVVPGERVDELLAEAEEKVATENEIRDSVRKGMLPLDAYERYGTF